MVQTNLVSLFILAFSSLVSHAATPADVEKLESQLRFKRTVPSGYEPSIPDPKYWQDLSRKLLREPTEDEKAIFTRRASATKWRTFDDEVIKFDLPDDPLINVEFVDQTKQNRNLHRELGAVTTANTDVNGFYEISVGKSRIRFAHIMVFESNWIDEGLCMCGPVDHRRFVIDDGNLIEYSFLPGGNLKKSQTLGAKRLAILFEWTHTNLHQDVYRKIAHSIRLKDKSPRSRKQWIYYTQKTGGPHQQIKWIGPGASRDDVINMLGKPDRKSPISFSYYFDDRDPGESGFRDIYKFRFSGRKIASMESITNSYTDLPPVYGTIAWAEEYLEETGTTFAMPGRLRIRQPAPPIDTMNREQVNFIVRRFLTQNPNKNPEHWDRWCRVAGNLAKRKHFDPAIRAHVEKFWNQGAAEYKSAFWVLQLYKVSNLKELSIARIERIYGDSSLYPKPVRYSDSFDFTHLFRAMETADPDLVRLIKKGMAHPEPIIRKSLARDLERVGNAALYRQLALDGLKDPSPFVRDFMASNIDEAFSKTDIPMLEALIEQETHKYVAKKMSKYFQWLVDDK